MSNETPQILTVQYQVTEADLIEALRYPRWGDPAARRRFFLRWGGVVAAMLLLCVVLWRLFGAEPVVSVAIPLVAITMLWPLVLWSQPRGVVQQLRKMPGVFEPGWACVRPEALVLGGTGTEGRREWQAVQDLVVTGKHTLFFFGPQNVVVVPWRSFGSPSEAQRFSELARHYWLTARSAPPSGPGAEEIAAALGPERIQVRYTLEMPEIQAYILHHMRSKRQALAFAATGAFVGGMAGSSWGLPGMLVGGVIGLICIPMLIVWLSLRQARSTPGVLAEQTLYFSPLGLWAVTPGVGQGRIEWSAITEVEGHPRLIILRRGPNHAIIIPRRAFAGSAEADRFLAQITRWRLPYASPEAPAKRSTK